MTTCNYSRTASGKCNQQPMPGKDVCFYHNKVREGLVETDERGQLVTLPTIKSK